MAVELSKCGEVVRPLENSTAAAANAAAKPLLEQSKQSSSSQPSHPSASQTFLYLVDEEVKILTQIQTADVAPAQGLIAALKGVLSRRLNILVAMAGEFDHEMESSSVF